MTPRQLSTDQCLALRGADSEEAYLDVFERVAFAILLVRLARKIGVEA